MSGGGARARRRGGTRARRRGKCVCGRGGGASVYVCVAEGGRLYLQERAVRWQCGHQFLQSCEVIQSIVALHQLLVVAALTVVGGSVLVFLPVSIIVANSIPCLSQQSVVS